jgi:hypothetical protein
MPVGFTAGCGLHHKKMKRKKHNKAKLGKVLKAVNATSMIMSLSPIPFMETTSMPKTTGKICKTSKMMEEEDDGGC